MQTRQPQETTAAQSAPSLIRGENTPYAQRQAKNRDFWDNQALRLGQAATCRSDWIAASTLRYIQKIAAVIEQPQILEVGCGDGNLIGRLQTPGHRTGLDQSRVMLEQAQQRFGEAVRLIEGDAAQLPFDDAEFDLSYSSRCLINIQDPEMQVQAIRELVRVTKPGGSIVLAENFRQGWSALQKLRARPGFVPLDSIGIQKPLDFDDVVQLFERSGCHLARWHQYRRANMFYHGILLTVFRKRGIGFAERIFRPVLQRLTTWDAQTPGHLPLLGKDTTLHFIVRQRH